MSDYHTPVLLKETVEFLNVQKDRKYIDCTLGGGGHTFGILEKGGVVLGIDVDQDSIDYVKDKFQISNFKFQIGRELVLARGNFRNLDEIARLNGFNNVWGIIFDLGVSSHQLESTKRGFSFQKDAVLDMRMDQDLGVKAKDLINALSKGELYDLFTKLGEEHNARAISNNIISARRIKPVETTGELEEIIRESTRGFSKINPATRVFQALRIAVNDELNSLKEALPKAIEFLESGGIIEVISFHSLEDRIVKKSFEEFEKNGLGKILTKKPVIPSSTEIEINKRSRSSKLRVFKKI